MISELNTIRHWRDPYAVCRADADVFFERTIPPICSGQLILVSDWTEVEGETFLGPPGEVIAKLTWPNGEPDEALFLKVVGALEEDLQGWQRWPAVVCMPAPASEVIA